MSHVLRRALLATMAAAVLVGLVATFASAAAKPNNPQITFTDPSSDGGLLASGAVGFTYNRIPNATKALTCKTTGPNNFSASGCTTPTADAVNGGSDASSQPLGALAPGSYTSTVTLTLTDKGTASATVHFTIPVFAEVSPTAQTFTYSTDYFPADSARSNVTALMQPAGGIIIPPNPLPAGPHSSSGCTASDFSSFTAGHIALIQRGTCNFGVKVLNAEAAGASGVVIFNEGQPGRTDVFGIGLFDANGLPITATIPVAFTSFAVGSSLYAQYVPGTAPVLHFDFR